MTNPEVQCKILLVLTCNKIKKLQDTNYNCFIIHKLFRVWELHWVAFAATIWHSWSERNRQYKVVECHPKKVACNDV